jgi:aryl sulfotransferase
MDHERWNDLRPRPDDIIVATYPKCGTTWTQRIVDMLIHQSAEPRPIMKMYPWLDATFFDPLDETLARLETQTHRRSIKSHLPFDSLPLFDRVKYIHVVRDGRDACFSMHNHQLGFTDAAKARIAAANPSLRRSEGGPPPTVPEDPRAYFLWWIAEAEAWPEAQTPGVPFCEFETTYWNERTLPNLLLVHYNDLKTDLAGEMHRISRFLEIDTPEDLLAELAQAARFEAMRKDGRALLVDIDTFFDQGHLRFLNKGVNGRWKDVLTADDLARYDAMVRDRLSPAAAAWIEHGRLVAGEPRDLPD